MTWPKQTIIFIFKGLWVFFSRRCTFFSERMPSCFAKFIQTIWMQILILLWWHFQMQRPNDQMTISCLKKYSYGEVLNIEICFHFSHLDSLQIDRKLCFRSIHLTLHSRPSPPPHSYSWELDLPIKLLTGLFLGIICEFFPNIRSQQTDPNF